MLPLVLLGAVALLLLRREQQAADACEQLEDPKAVLACKVARGLVGVGYDKFRDAWRGEDKNVGNVALNGPVVEWFDAPETADLYTAASGYDGKVAPTKLVYDGRGPNGEKYPAQYENGCVPLPGHPAWSKCAPGTESMASDAFPRYAGKDVRRDDVGTGDPQRDGLTFRWEDRITKTARVADHDPPVWEPRFPLEVPEGATAWVVRGKPHVCPAGTEVRGRDHRTGQETRSPCSIQQTITPPPVAPQRDGDCIRYYIGDRLVRDCRTGATMPPGATATPPTRVVTGALFNFGDRP